MTPDCATLICFVNDLLDLIFPVLTVLFVVLIVLMALGTQIYGVITFYLWKLRRRAQMLGPDARSEIVGDAPVPPAARTIMQRAEPLGFARFGQLQSKMKTEIDWVLIDESRSVLLLAIRHQRRQHAAIFYTQFSDGFLLETVYPQGIHMTLDWTRVESVKSSLQAAYDFHLYQVDLEHGTHGDPIAFEDMFQVEEWYNSTVRRQFDVKSALALHQSSRMMVLMGLGTIITTIGGVYLMVTEFALGPLVATVLALLLLVALFQRVRLPEFLQTVDGRKKQKR